jgi:hypothetical protein
MLNDSLPTGHQIAFWNCRCHWFLLPCLILSFACLEASGDRDRYCVNSIIICGGGLTLLTRRLTFFIIPTQARKIIVLSPSTPSVHCGNYMYHIFNVTKFLILPRECIQIFQMILRMNSDCFGKQHLPFALCNVDAVCLFEVCRGFVHIVQP